MNKEKVLEVIDTVKAQYPESVFPKDVERQDCKSALMARVICDNIKREMEIAYNNEDESQASDKDKEIEGLKDAFKEQFDEAQKYMRYEYENAAEIDRLKGLIEKVKKECLELIHTPVAGFKLDEILNQEIEAGWQQFKTKNNL